MPKWRKQLQIALLAMREAFSDSRLDRQPEPSVTMSAAESVRAFHEQGGEAGALLSVYHFNAAALSAMVPAGGAVLDLGCGSGQFLAHLARCRPDVRIDGLDLSAEMVAVGNRMLREAGLHQRVRLHEGDMTAFANWRETRPDIISAVFSLHHLPTFVDLERCIAQIAAIRRKCASALWVFDHARPKLRSTAAVFPKVFTPDASPAFKQDSCNSLIASWSFTELRNALQRELGGTTVRGALARLLPLYQVHWIHGADQLASARATWMEPATVNRAAKNEARQLAALFSPKPALDW